MIEFQTFHTGRPLNLWERCCLKSFVDHGHEVVLYGYEPIEVPEGVRFAPAQNVISEREREEFFRIAPERFSQFSNLFRYTLLARHGGWWIDTDILCLSDELPSGELVIGYQSADSVGTAILRFPPGHKLLADAIGFARDSRGVELWGYTGPKLLTRLVAEHGLGPRLHEPRVFYPVHWFEVYDLIDPERREQVEKLVAGSPVVHLWNQTLRIVGIQPGFLPPAGSFLSEAFRRHGGADAPELDPETYISHIRSLRRALVRRFEIDDARSEIERLRQELAFARATALRDATD